MYCISIENWWQLYVYNSQPRCHEAPTRIFLNVITQYQLIFQLLKILERIMYYELLNPDLVSSTADSGSGGFIYQ